MDVPVSGEVLGHLNKPQQTLLLVVGLCRLVLAPDHGGGLRYSRNEPVEGAASSHPYIRSTGNVSFLFEYFIPISSSSLRWVVILPSCPSTGCSRCTRAATTSHSPTVLRKIWMRLDMSSMSSCSCNGRSCYAHYCIFINYNPTSTFITICPPHIHTYTIPTCLNLNKKN